MDRTERPVDRYDLSIFDLLVTDRIVSPLLFFAVRTVDSGLAAVHDEAIEVDWLRHFGHSSYPFTIAVGGGLGLDALPDQVADETKRQERQDQDEQ